MKHLITAAAIAALAWALVPAATLASPAADAPRAASESQRPANAQKSVFVTPEQLLSDLKRPNPPIVVQVGIQSLYEDSHVPGALHFQDVNTPKGKAAFLKDLKQLPKDRDIVLYCGCCPFDFCPFIQPAIAVAHPIRGERIKLLALPNSFEEDWVAKGFPVE